MTAPLVSALPTAPSRLSKPSNFVSESNVFLDSLPLFTGQVNSLNAYLNTQFPNKYNYGTVNGIRDFTSVFQTSLIDIQYTGNSISYTSDIDTFFSQLQAYSVGIDTWVNWFLSVVDEVGLTPIDENKPIIDIISEPMGRNQSIEDFNTFAVAFNQTSAYTLNSTYDSLMYTFGNSCGDNDAGLILETVSTTTDSGLITDTTITY